MYFKKNIRPEKTLTEYRGEKNISQSILQS